MNKTYVLAFTYLVVGYLGLIERIPYSEAFELGFLIILVLP